MTHQIELFQSSVLEDLERLVNDFIQKLDYEVIDIKISSASQGPEYKNPVTHCVMIVYDYKRSGEL